MIQSDQDILLRVLREESNKASVDTEHYVTMAFSVHLNIVVRKWHNLRKKIEMGQKDN